MQETGLSEQLQFYHMANNGIPGTIMENIRDPGGGGQETKVYFAMA